MHTTLNTNLRVRWGFILLLTSFNLKSQTFQNLVPNGSFEVQTNCPTSNSQLNLATPWFLGASTDLYDTCAPIATTANVPYVGGVFYDTVYPKHGHALVGMHLYSGREYAQVQLTTSLTAARCYYVEFFTRRQGISSHAINNVGANISTNSYTSYPSPLMMPIHISMYNNPIIKDTNNWTRVCGLYNSMGGEKYITLGNMTDDQNTNTELIHPNSPFNPTGYYFIDAVSVFSINPTGNLPWKYRDTTIVEGDSVYIGNTMGGSFNPKWYTINGNYIATNAGLYVKPAATTSYVVNYTVCGTTRADTVEVKVVSDIGIREKLLREVGFKIFPNPAKDEIEIICEESFTKPKQLRITDMLGKEVYRALVNTKKQKIDVSNLDNGVYIVSIKNNQNETVTKKVVVSK